MMLSNVIRVNYSFCGSDAEALVDERDSSRSDG